ncbi:MAG: PPK2 family polyphosphate kinase, partial [Chitinophagales bacterium]
SISTKAPGGLSKKKTKKETAQLQERLAELQNMLFAQGKHSLLIVLQGMDASGKGGATRKTFSQVNPLGVNVHSFKKPSDEEAAHDFLWRVHKVAPRKGMIQIFDRSHYEEVLICRVMGWVDDEKAHRYFNYINMFEQLLEENGTKILKFYLHVSEEEQQARFHERLTDPRKKWKFSDDDLEKAKQWADYRKMYEDIFEHCSPENPWHIVPTDNNWYKEHYIVKTVVECLEGLDMDYPKGEITWDDPDTKALVAKFG